MPQHTIKMVDDDGKTEVDTTLTIDESHGVFFSAPWGTYRGQWDPVYKMMNWEGGIEPDISACDIIESYLLQMPCTG